jgi:uncharacterized protein involved in outer membrane biogenesis
LKIRQFVFTPLGAGQHGITFDISLLIMKRVLKVSGIVALVLVLTMLAVPFLFKGKIVRMVRSYANEAVNARIHFSEDISISLFRSFPSLSLGIDSLQVIGVDSFSRDTLLHCQNLRLSLDLMSVIRGEKIEVERIALQNPNVLLRVLPSGKANWDIAKPDSGAADTSITPSSFQLSLQELKIDKGQLVYDDQSLGFYTALRDFDHTLRGDFTSEKFLMQTETQAADFTMGYGGINWISHVKADILADLDMDMPASKYTFRKGDIKLNELGLKAEGFVQMLPESIDMNIQFAALQNEFKAFLSLLPGMYTADFNKIKTAGQLALSGQIKGKYTETALPAFNLDLKVEKGMFHYPDLPYPASDINLALRFANPDGNPDHSEIDLKSLRMVVAGEPFTAAMLLKTPISDPDLKASFNGRLDLAKIAGLIPLGKDVTLSGMLAADLRAIGRYSSLALGKYLQFEAAGQLALDQLHYVAPGSPALHIKALKLSFEPFTPAGVSMPVCDGSYGKSDFQARGKLDNLIGYALGKEVLRGRLDVNSRYFDCNELMSSTASPEEQNPADTGRLEAVALPTNLDLTLGVKAGTIRYDNLKMEAVEGNAHIYEGKLDLQGLKANLLGGRVAFDGTYDGRDVQNPFAGMHIKAESISIPESYAYFGTVQRFAPVAKHAQGLFDCELDVKSVLDAHMAPKYPSMNVQGKLSISQAAINNLEILKRLAAQLNVPALEALTLKDLRFGFEILNGEFRLKDTLALPLPQGMRMRLGGGAGLDGKLAYGGHMMVPSKLLGSGHKLLSEWKSRASEKGVNVDVPAMIPVDLGIGGTWLQPDVRIGLRSAARSVGQDLKDQAKQQLEEQRRLAEARVRDSLNQLTQRAKTEADRAKQEAEARAAEERRKAEERLQAEKRKAEEEARRRAEEEKKKAADKLKERLRTGTGGGGL